MISLLRTFWKLGRASTLPTIWSNCLAGWWLGGAEHIERLCWLLTGASFLYLGGSFVNDAFDAEFDCQHRRVRPIPSGVIKLDTVRNLGLTFLALGALSLLVLGTLAGGMGLVLIGTILLYNSIHRLILFSPVLLGICRLFLYLIAASTSNGEITGRAIWCGLALVCYTVGLSYFAPRERSSSPLSYWPVLALASPVLLALIMNAGGYRENALLISAVVALWIAQCLRYTLWSAEREPPRTIGGLIAGIAFVDWLAVADGPKSFAALFLVLFGATLALQKWD